MQKHWLDSYPEHVPEEINPDEYSSVLDVFEQSVAKYSDRPAFNNMGAILTYAELDKKATDFAAYLQNELGLQQGDRLAIMMPNLLQYPIAVFGGFKAGLTLINVNPLYTERELKHQLNDANADAILIVANFAHTLEAVIGQVPLKHVIVTQLGDMLGGIKKHIVNFVVKRVKKMVPKYSLPNAVNFTQALVKGSKLNLKKIESHSQ